MPHHPYGRPGSRDRRAAQAGSFTEASIGVVKSSEVREFTVWSGGEQAGQGWEQGSWWGSGDADEHRSAVPDTPDWSAAGLSDDLGPPARALREALASAVSIRDEHVALRLTTAATLETLQPDETRETAETNETLETKSCHPRARRGRVSRRRWSRRVAAAQALLGPRAELPSWSRIAPLSGALDRWPDGWPGAADRAVWGWLAGRADRVEGKELPSGPLVLDAFALADLLRVESKRWTRSARRGGTVASSAVSIDDPGFAFPADGEDRDGLGAAVRAEAVVRRGVLQMLPADARDGRPLPGFAVRESWRRPPSAGWRSLALDAARTEAPASAIVVTRVQILGGRVLASGHLTERGRRTACFGPIGVPPPAWWLSGICGAVGEAVPDATGLPVCVPPVLIDRPIPRAPA